jgi:hypothetical protein
MPKTNPAQGANVNTLATIEKRGRHRIVLTQEVIKLRAERKKVNQAKYLSKPETKIIIKKHRDKYMSKPEAKSKLLENNKKYQQTQAFKESVNKYQQTDKGIAAIARSRLKQKERREAKKLLKPNHQTI